MLKIIFFTFLTILFFQKSSACEVDLKKIEMLENDPTRAIVVLSGTIVGDRFNTIFKFRVNEKDKILYISSTPCFRPRVVENTSYLFLSEKNLNQLSVTNIRVTSGIFINLKDARVDIDKLSMKNEIIEGEPNFLWKYCQEDKECVQTKNVCTDTVSVNEKYKSNYDAYVKNFKAEKDCKSLISNKIKNKCVNYFCE